MTATMKYVKTTQNFLIKRGSLGSDGEEGVQVSGKVPLNIFFSLQKCDLISAVICIWLVLYLKHGFCVHST